MTKYKQIIAQIQNGLSDRKIASALHVSRTKVGEVRRAWSTAPQDKLANLPEMTEEEVGTILFPGKPPKLTCEMPDFAHVHKELLRDGVTLQLLWGEYEADCRRKGVIAYKYSRFCDLYRQYTEKANVTSHIDRRPGDSAQVDWAGKKLRMTDPVTGREMPVYLFVGVLPYSMYSFAEGFLNMREESWIQAHVDMFAFFGGSARLLICDNTKTAILCNRRQEDPLVNTAYQELADHYDTALLPARVRRPKDYLKKRVI